MFTKILIANRGDKARRAGLAATPQCLVRKAHAGDLDPMELMHVQ